MKDEPYTPIERLSVARLSDDLTLKKVRCDVDALIASAYSALRVNPRASDAIRLRLTMDASAWSGALARAKSLAISLNYREKWRLEDVQLLALATISLKQFLVPVCPACCGRRFEAVDGTGRLSAKVCKTCQGTGERPFPKDFGRQVRAIVRALEDDESKINSALRGVLR